MLGQHAFLWLLLALALVHGLLYLVLIPPWQCPDEPYHFLSAHLVLLEQGETGEAELDNLKQETMRSMLAFHYWERVSGAPLVSSEAEAAKHLPNGFKFTAETKPRSWSHYVMAGWLAPLAKLDVTTQLYWGRLLSVAALMGVVTIAYAAGRLLFTGDLSFAILAPLILLWHPQHSVIFAGISDGVPAEFFSSAAILVWLWGAARGWRWQNVVGLAILVVIAIATKASNLFLIIAIPAWILIIYWRLLLRGKSLVLLAIVVVALLGAASLSRYTVNAYLSGLIPALAEMVQGQVSVGERLPSVSGLFATFRSFWLTVGWNTLLLSFEWGYVWLALTALALMGGLRSGYLWLRSARQRASCGWDKWRSVSVLVLCLLAAMLASGLLVFVTGIYRSDGRYFLSVSLPIAALLALGWRELLPVRWRAQGLAVLVSGMFLFDTVALVVYAVPYFYPLWY